MYLEGKPNKRACKAERRLQLSEALSYHILKNSGNITNSAKNRETFVKIKDSKNNSNNNLEEAFNNNLPTVEFRNVKNTKRGY